MARHAFGNELNEVEVSLAIERLLIADYPASFTPARIDFDALPSGFYDLGSVKEDTPKVKVTREKYELETGLPRVLQFTSVVGLKGSFECMLYSNSWRKVQVAFGNYTATASAASVASISSVHSNGLTFVLSTTPTTPLAVGQQVIISSLNMDAIDATEVRIASITSGNLVYTISSVPIKAITAGLAVGVYGRVTQAIGGRSNRFYHILGVADFIDGVQIIHEMRKVQPSADWEESFVPNSAGMIPINMQALGFNTVLTSCTEQVIALRHYFPPLSAMC